MSEAIIIQNKTTASVVRKSIENRVQLPKKGDIYIGTGNEIQTGIPDTKGQNIIDAINDNAADKVIEAKDFVASSKVTSSKVTALYYQTTYGSSGSDKNCINFDNSGATGENWLYFNVNTPDGKTTKITNIGFQAGEKDTWADLTAGTFNAMSDKRLKENIVEYSPNKSILDLPIYSYNFISDEKKTKKIGCLAQDLKEICTEIVKEDDKGYLSIEENKIVYLLLDEVKKLKKRVDELEAR